MARWALVSMLVFLSCSAWAQAKPPEYSVKAAYLVNFGKFAKWPSEPSTFSICVIGKDPFGGSLERIVSGEAIGGRPIVVRDVSAMRKIDDCQILFIGNSERARLGPILASVQGQSVLTVSDIPEFLERGGMIQFEIVDNRVRFSINLRQAREAKLNISSDLLNVAVKVEGR